MKEYKIPILLVYSDANNLCLVSIYGVKYQQAGVLVKQTGKNQNITDLKKISPWFINICMTLI